MKIKRGVLLPFVLLVLSAYAFWVLPGQMAKPKMQIRFESAKAP